MPTTRIVPLATTEIRRAKSRYALLAGAVSFLVLLLLLLNSISAALISSFTGAVRNQDTDVFVYSDVSRRNFEASRLPTSLATEIAQVDGVDSVAPWAASAYTVTRPDGDTENVAIVGFEPGLPGAPRDDVVGRSGGQPGPGGALLTEADLGDFPEGTSVTTTAGGGSITVNGTVTGANYLGQPTFWVPFATFRELQRAAFPGAPVDTVTNVFAVRTDEGADPAEVAARIQATIDGVEALDRDAAVAALPGVAAIQASFGLIVGATAAIVVLVVGFFFVIFTVQKLRAYAALRAIGAGVGSLARATLVQIAIVVLAASAIAVLLLFGVLQILPSGLPIPVSWPLVGQIVAAMLVASLLAGLISVRRIAKADPAEVASGRFS
jgi:putative ABC transport system permease protein